jgi:SAM-dependent methyltransferase
MPFSDASFDVVWTQHAAMNIADKQRLYSEIYRVLRPGGRFALHDIMAGAVSPVHFPVPWSHEPETSHLAEPEALRALLKSVGFREIAWVDETATALEWFQLRGASAPGGAAALSLRSVIGDDFAVMFGNQVRNLKEGRITVYQGVFERPN